MTHFFDKGSAFGSTQKPYYNDDPIMHYSIIIIRGFNIYKKENRIYEHISDNSKNTLYILKSLQRAFASF